MAKTIKKRVAVIFGGPSVEHDISILTGLQVLEAIDTTRYDAFPIYVDQDNFWYAGDILRSRTNYPCNKQLLQRVLLSIGNKKRFGQPHFNLLTLNPFKRHKTIPFDIAFPTFHGTFGEDGFIQGLFEAAQIPYTGPRLLAASLSMNKPVAKRFYRGLDIHVLPDQVIERPAQGTLLDITLLGKNLSLPFPLCAKPCNLGSSVGVYCVKDIHELHTALIDIFRFDTTAILEPFIDNLVEYNIAVMTTSDRIQLSPIEKPLSKGKLLSFQDKYLVKGLSTKLATNQQTEGMASAPREFNPKELTEKQKQFIINNAQKLAKEIPWGGTPRIDFYCNKVTQEIWLNEINPIPGSLAFYLWEKATPSLNFTGLLTLLIEEGFKHHRITRSTNILQANAQVFKK
jgi:D-alanine-D-alanine ligase